MDEIKDIGRKDAISKFLNDKATQTQPFGGNIAGERAYRRTERIVAAVHLVTNHVAANEPARGAARETSIGLLSSVLALRDEMRASSLSLVQVQVLIRKLISLIRTLSAAGNLSLQNADILINAIDELGVFLLASQRTSLSESVALSRDEFMDTGVASSSVAQPSKRQKPSTIKDKIKKITSLSDRVGKGNVRTDAILNVLRAQGTVGIKDIVAHLPEYSEKMIQRELKSLVALERVKKAGSKRWSMYSLAQ